MSIKNTYGYFWCEMSGIGARIKEIRKDLLQDELAARLNVSKMTVGRWERGEREPDYSNLVAILKEFSSINPGWLLTGEGPKELDVALQLLTNVIMEVEGVLDEEDLVLAPAKKAKLITYLYSQKMRGQPFGNFASHIQAILGLM
ncbi:MAG: helix-turn-helix transcriptional regulator [Deltaproteobacteria bacterium]|nr:helix-turn-helix transcriptional regulator [Deltaproteobacteria bacterium]